MRGSLMTQDELREFLEQADYVQMLLKECITAQVYSEDALINAIDLIDELHAIHQADLIYHRYQRYMEDFRADEETD